MITLSFPDLVALGVLFLTLFVLLDRRALLREMKRTRREVKALREALTMQGKPTKRGYIPPVLRQKVIERSEYTCQYCGGLGDEANGPDGLPWHVDHVVPVSKGGPTHDGNLTLSCEACNLSKGVLQAEEFNGETSVSDEEPIVRIDSRREPTSIEAEAMRQYFTRTGSKTGTCNRFYGYKDGATFDYVTAAIEGRL